MMKIRNSRSESWLQKKKGPNRTQETKIDGPHIRPNALNVNKIQREATSGFSITEWTTYMEI